MTKFSVVFNYERVGAQCTVRVTVPAVDGVEADRKVSAALQRLMDADTPAERPGQQWGVWFEKAHSALIGGEVKPYPERVASPMSTAGTVSFEPVMCSFRPVDLSFDVCQRLATVRVYVCRDDMTIGEVRYACAEHGRTIADLVKHADIIEIES